MFKKIFLLVYSIILLNFLFGFNPADDKDKLKRSVIRKLPRKKFFSTSSTFHPMKWEEDSRHNR
jgi:hypothetical protein